MSTQAAITELRSSRRWVTTMAILAIILLSLWVIVFTAIWFRPDTLRMYQGWMQAFFLGFMTQLTLYAYAAVIPFLNLCRYARSLFALGDGDREGLALAIDLNIRFWRQCSYLMWGMVWLLTYMVGGSIIGTLLGGK